jgi:O-acetyl-ADP-ribose deacetylase (regulator of RNase III)
MTSSEHDDTQVSRVEVVSGNLLTQDVDAIVNPANEELHNDGGLRASASRANCRCAP